MNSQSKQMDITAFVRKNGLVAAFLVFLAFVAINAEGFFTVGNLLDVLRQVSITGIMAIGVTFVVITGRLDLSVGSALTLLTVIVVDQHNISGPGMAIILTLLGGLAIGVANGFLVAFLGFNALIVTLAMLSFLQGLVLFYSGGANVNISNPNETWFAIFGREKVYGIPVPAILFLLLAWMANTLLTKTEFGRRVYAVGGNETASIFSGVKSNRVVFLTYVISGIAVAIAAIVMGSRVMGAQNTIGQGYELTVLAGVILGGTSMLGGSGTIYKTVLGATMLGCIQNGLLLLGFPYYVQWLVTWAVIVIAVWIDLAAKRGKVLA